MKITLLLAVLAVARFNSVCLLLLTVKHDVRLLDVAAAADRVPRHRVHPVGVQSTQDVQD